MVMLMREKERETAQGKGDLQNRGMVQCSAEFKLEKNCSQEREVCNE